MKINNFVAKHIKIQNVNKESWGNKRRAIGYTKITLSILGLDFWGNLMGKTIYKCMVKDLEGWGIDAEILSESKIGIYETQI